MWRLFRVPVDKAVEVKCRVVVLSVVQEVRSRFLATVPHRGRASAPEQRIGDTGSKEFQCSNPMPQEVLRIAHGILHGRQPYGLCLGARNM
jgi:hypothetical protein